MLHGKSVIHSFAFMNEHATARCLLDPGDADLRDIVLTKWLEDRIPRFRGCAVPARILRMRLG